MTPILPVIGNNFGFSREIKEKETNILKATVLHSRDDEGVGMAHEMMCHPASVFPDDDGTVSKQAFRSTQNAFKKLLQTFNYLVNRISTD